MRGYDRHSIRLRGDRFRTLGGDPNPRYSTILANPEKWEADLEFHSNPEEAP